MIVDRDRVREDAARRDLERLQGSWSFVSGQREAQLLISGGHFTMRFRNGDTYVGTCSLDPTSRPRAMDLRIDEGPEPHRGKTALAIYEFDGDHLIWCPAPPGAGERPRAFPPGDDPGHLCLVFRRDRG
ncbi:MAG: TIGR03067 domain-containing protein [Gemmataceae bacterium]